MSQPSVSRFASALGFASFNDLREEIRTTTRRAVGPVGGSFPGAMTGHQRLIESEIATLRRLQEDIAEPSALERAARELIVSRPLPVVGLRISRPLATLFAQFAEKVLPDVRLLTHGGSQLCEAVERARRDGASCLLAFGLPRYPRELRDCMTWARKLGLTVILVTDDAYSNIVDEADQLLVAGVSHEFTFDSYAGPIVLCGLLLQAIVDELPPDNLKGLDRFDDVAQAGGFFVP